MNFFFNFYNFFCRVKCHVINNKLLFYCCHFILDPGWYRGFSLRNKAVKVWMRLVFLCSCKISMDCCSPVCKVTYSCTHSSAERHNKYIDHQAQFLFLCYYNWSVPVLVAQLCSLLIAAFTGAMDFILKTLEKLPAQGE